MFINIAQVVQPKYMQRQASNNNAKMTLVNAKKKTKNTQQVGETIKLIICNNCSKKKPAT